MLEIRYYDHLAELLGAPKGKPIAMSAEQVEHCKNMLGECGYAYYKALEARMKK